MRATPFVLLLLSATACDPLRNRVDDKLIDSVPEAERQKVTATQADKNAAAQNEQASKQTVAAAEQAVQDTKQARLDAERGVDATRVREKWSRQKLVVERVQAQLTQQRAVLADAINEREKARLVKAKGLKPTLDLAPFEAAVPDQERRIAELEAEEARERAEAKRLESELRLAEGPR